MCSEVEIINFRIKQGLEREREREGERDLHSLLHTSEKVIQIPTYIQVYSQVPGCDNIAMHMASVIIEIKFFVHTKRSPPIKGANGFVGSKSGVNRPQLVLHPSPSMQSLPLNPSSDKR